MAATARANIIQNFLRDHMTGDAKQNLNRIFNDSYRKHFVKCIGDLMKFWRLKNAMAHPWNRQSMDAINLRVKNNKLRDRFRMIMGFSDANNRGWIKREMARKWNLIAQKNERKRNVKCFNYRCFNQSKINKDQSPKIQRT